MIKVKRKVGLLTWHYYTNYGSMLQAFALQNTISMLGYEPVFINYRKRYVKSPIYVRFIWFFLYKLPYAFVSKYLRRFFYPCDRFIKTYLKETRILKSESELKSIVRDVDIFICGSDQIWAPNVFNPIYMLSFVPDIVGKVSYAASIGLNEIPKKYVADYKKFIGRLNYVSVREEQGHNILWTQCGIDSDVVLDPTLLVNINEWRSIEISSNIEKPFIFCYFLKNDHSYKNSVISLSKQIGFDIYGISENPTDYEWMHVLTHKDVGPREFLGLISGAQLIITDSYHGTIFSLLYHKNFITFERFAETDEICQNSRVFQLVKYFGISNNIVSADDKTPLVIYPVNYSNFDKTLNELRYHSLQFINNALLSC